MLDNTKIIEWEFKKKKGAVPCCLLPAFVVLCTRSSFLQCRWKRRGNTNANVCVLCDVKEGRLTRAGIVFSVMQRDRAESHGQSTLISNIFIEFILYKITKSYLNVIRTAIRGSQQVLFRLVQPPIQRLDIEMVWVHLCFHLNNRINWFHFKVGWEEDVTQRPPLLVWDGGAYLHTVCCRE